MPGYAKLMLTKRDDLFRPFIEVGNYANFNFSHNRREDFSVFKVDCARVIG